MTYEEYADVILPTPDGLGCEFRAWKPNKYHSNPVTHILIEKLSGEWSFIDEGSYEEMAASVADYAEVKINMPDLYEELLIVPYPKEYVNEKFVSTENI